MLVSHDMQFSIDGLGRSDHAAPVRRDRSVERGGLRSDLPRGDLRPGAGDPALRQRRRSRGRSQQYALCLASYVQAKDLKKAREIASLMRTGNVHINYPAWDAGIPFGGFKQSGNGRKYAE